ncbi:MAG: O-antigen ligase family protein [Elusimicrobiales bacterium]|nr:O-antigen ligase family protein [Elusimicrobiales bacterium]
MRFSLDSIAETGILVGLCVFAGSVCLSVSVMEIGLALVLVSLAVKASADASLRNGLASKVKADYLPVPWLIYLAAGFVAVIFGLDLRRGLAWWLPDLVKAGFYFVLICAMNEKRSEPVFRFYLGGAIAASVYGIVQFLRVPPLSRDAFRSHGTMNAITYAEVLLIAFAFSASRLIYAEKRGERVLYAAGCVIIAAALFMSSSRSPLAGCALVMITMSVIETNRLRRLLPALAAILLAFAITYGSGSPIRSRFVGIFDIYSKYIRQDARYSRSTVIGDERLELWRTGLAIARDYPIFGVGTGNIKTTFDFYHPKPMLDNFCERTVFGYGSVHNLYIQQLAEKGLAGFFSLCLLLFAMLYQAWKNLRANRTWQSLWLFSVMPAFFLINITETSFQHAVVAGSLMLALSCRSGNVKLRLWPPALAAAGAALLAALVLFR